MIRIRSAVQDFTRQSMCGIFGVLRPDRQTQPEQVSTCLSLLSHRGPDGEGVWRRPADMAPFVALAHRRLAIIDLSAAAAQPMSSDDGSRWITHNGEIYNYVELMQELQAKGHRFRSVSDTEVILKAFEEWGADCLSRFNGMFAFAIWDERKQELFAARDRFGEKPFHYTWDAQRGFFAFASEIKSLLALPEVACALDDRALYRFLAFQELAVAEQTLWQSIKRLPHAHWLKLSWRGDSFDLTVRRYWDIDLERTEEMSLQHAAEHFSELFADSVRLRLRSDVTVGSSLSGGLDSSAVVCQVHALGAAGGQQTFSARMEDPALDEGKHIATVLSKTGIKGHDVWPSADELEKLFPKLCYHLEEPFLSTSQFAQHLVMRLASENDVTVLLDGQGADEILAGYQPYYLTRYGDLASDWQLFKLWQEWRGFRQRHDRAFPLNAKALAARLSPGLYQLVSRNSKDRSSSRDFWPEMRAWWNVEWLAEFADEPPPALPVTRRDQLTRKLYADTMGGELQELLRYGDRNSMAWSREVRQPFLDHRLAEFLFTLPPEYKHRQGETKVVMRRAMKGLLPEPILNRQDKLGYQAPMAAWLSDSLESWAAEKLQQTIANLDGRMSAGAADQFMNLTRPLKVSDAWAVFSLLTIGETREQLQAVASAPVGC